MKKFPISYLDLSLCLEDNSRDINEYYLDAETGEVITIDLYLYHKWEKGEKINKEDLPQWQQEKFDTMMAVFNDVSRQRYHPVPQIWPDDDADIMRRFMRTVRNEMIADELFGG